MRTRLRRLRVGGREFTWRAVICHVPGELDCHRGIRLRVWAGGKTSRPLQVDLVSRAWPAPWGACASDNAYPQPHDVRAIIVFALANGWQCDARGGVFLVTEGEHVNALELPDFLVTDRIQVPEAADPSARVVEAFERSSRENTTTQADSGGPPR
ncbi:hypothetical protein [Micromonospora sp. NPDC050200]|uniref:hypothetical protein n=1 Tax=Micromonospora sp. NPDC050200 TaxID=3155664 RepID=UPI0033F4A30F